jgi:hypothetical protein
MTSRPFCGDCDKMVRFCTCCGRWVHVFSDSHYCDPASAGTVANPREREAALELTTGGDQ